MEYIERSDSKLRSIYILFFLAGFPALIYQLAWQRTLFRIFGVNIESVTIVVTAFMLGLGLGSLAGGWLSKRTNIQPLSALSTIEFLTGAFGLASLAVFDKVGSLTAGQSLFATGAATLALVIVPTLLMGATLPLLVGHVASRFGNVGKALGLLYYVNTLGAATACILATVLLFPFLGMSGAIYAAVTINFAVALGAIVAQRYDVKTSRLGPDLLTTPPSTFVKLRRAPILLLAAMGGFISLSYEIFFFRAVSFATGSSVTAFAITLSAFLFGLASGSREAGKRCETAPPSDLMMFAVRALIIANLIGLIVLPLLGLLAWAHFGILIAMLMMVYLIARFWGSLLPYLAGIAIMPDARAGMNTALIYLANILGSAAGAIITGFVLMEHFGFVAVGTILAVAGSISAMVLALVLPALRRKNRYQTLAVGLALTAAVAIPYASTNVLESLHWKGSPNAQPFVQIVENRNGIIAATRDRAVIGNGMYDGHFNTDLKQDINGIVRPYALSLFHPAPRNVLVIGLASGSWSQVLANNPHVEKLTIVEINSGYLTLIQAANEVSSLLSNPKVTLVIDDGRRWLRANPDRRFDAIVSNTTWHFRANATNLLSVEFLTLVRRHLNPGGIFFYNTTGSDRVQRTGCLVFQHGARFTNHMVVSDQSIRWDFDRWRRTLESYSIDGEAVFRTARGLDRAKLEELASWEESLRSGQAADTKRPIEDCGDILIRTAGKGLVTDDNMGSEWRYFLGLE
jgi:spermidine synthase